jgi:hypothetical protein
MFFSDRVFVAENGLDDFQEPGGFSRMLNRVINVFREVAV